MNYLRQIQRGIDYIEEHLDEDIHLAEVTRFAGVSHWHFQRMFKALTNETLKAYIRSRRLANSRMKLVQTDESVLTIAIEAGFESQASFTRAFKKAFGLPPARYRAIGDKHLFLKKIRIEEDYLRHLREKVSRTPTIERIRSRTLIGMTTQFYSVDSERNNIGDKLPPLWRDFLPRLGEINHVIAGTCYGVIGQSAPDSELLQYTAAAEIPSAAKEQPLPQGMEMIIIPETIYAVFTHRGEVNNIDHTVNYIYSNWLSQSGKRHTYGFDLEIYGADYRADSEESIIHYAIPITESI